MPTKTGYAPHETINVHEALRSSAIELAKLELMKPLVQDADLKRFLDAEISNKKKDVQQLENWAQKIIG
jgi:similar to spore coat protein